MKKTIAILTLSLMLVVISAMAFAQTNKVTLTADQQSALSSLYKQEFEIQKQILQARVSYGQLTQDQADKMIARHQQHFDRMQANGFDCPPPNMHDGKGMMGQGNGDCPHKDGGGPGHGNGGGPGNNPNCPQTPQN